MVCKRSLLVLLLLLSSVVLTTMKNIHYAKLNSMGMRKVHFKSERKSKSSKTRTAFYKSTFLRRSPEKVCGGGMIQKTCFSDLPGRITELIKDHAPILKEYADYVKTALDFIIKNMKDKLDFCVGDLTGKELKLQTALKCDVIPYKEDIQMSTIALKVGGLPCGSGNQSIEFCFTYDKCGSFGLVYNSGIPVCIATATGVGEIVAPFLETISHVGYAFNINNNIAKEFNVYAINSENKFVSKKVTIEANIFMTFELDLADAILPDEKIGEKKLSDMFEIKGSITAMLDYGKLFTNLAGVIADQRKATKDKALDFIKSIFKSKAEVGFNMLADIKFKLKELTDGFLPDIDLGNANLDFIATFGEGRSGLNAGVYVRLQLSYTYLTSFYKLFKDIFKPIFELFGYRLPDWNGDITLDIAITVTTEVVGISLGGGFGEKSGSFSCVIRLSDLVLTCGNHTIYLFSILKDIKDKAKWVIYKAKELFEKIGNEIIVFFDEAGRFLSDFFTGKGYIPSYCPSNKVYSDGLCYSPCKSGYYQSFASCINSNKCPSPHTDNGLSCLVPIDSCNGWAWDHKNCGDWGYNTINSCCSYYCPDFTVKVLGVCWKKSYVRMDGTVPDSCAPGDHKDNNGLCYKNIKAKLKKFSRNEKIKSEEIQIIQNIENENLKQIISISCKENNDMENCKKSMHCDWVNVGSKENQIEKCVTYTQKITQNAYLLGGPLSVEKYEELNKMKNEYEGIEFIQKPPNSKSENFKKKRGK